MIEKLIAMSARRPITVLAVVATWVAFAIHSMRGMPLDALPDLSDTQVIV